MKQFLTLVILLSAVMGYSQRIVFPDQELLSPQLNDPSFIGEDKRVAITALYQFASTETDLSSTYANAQLPIFDNVAFGVDYFRNDFDFFSYTSGLFSTTFSFNLGSDGHYLRLGLSGGAESRKQDRIPLSQLDADPPIDINDNNLEFAYSAGLHYTYRNLTLGGYLNSLPTQLRVASTDPTVEDELTYIIEDGYTAYLLYRINLSSNFGITPIAQYRSYTDEAIYEGALKLDYKDIAAVVVSYKDNYAINPSVRFRPFGTLDISYSYEKAIGDMNFDDIHAVGLSYRFNRADGEQEPEWMRQAQKTIQKIEEIKVKKPKKEKEPEAKVVREPTELPEKEVVKEIVDELAPKEVPDPNVDTNTLMLKPGYYIIAQSFNSLKAAERFVRKLKGMDYYSAIGKSTANSKYHVFIDADTDGGEAQKRLKAQRLDPNFKNAVLLRVR